VWPLSHLTSCTPTEPDLYFASSVTTAFSDCDILTNLTMHVTILMSAFRCFLTPKASLQVRGSLQLFVRCSVFTASISYPSPNPRSGGPHPFSAVRYCSFSSAPCRCDKDRLPFAMLRLSPCLVSILTPSTVAPATTCFIQ
jgi:hypothetical protein